MKIIIAQFVMMLMQINTKSNVEHHQDFGKIWMN